MDQSRFHASIADDHSFPATRAPASLAATAGALLLLMSMHPGTSGATGTTGTTGSLMPLIAIGAIAFCLLGPYSSLGGAFALDFGGRQAAAAASGIIDGAG